MTDTTDPPDSSNPSNHGKDWLPEHYALLTRLFAASTPMEDMQRQLGRTRISLEVKLCSLRLICREPNGSYSVTNAGLRLRADKDKAPIAALSQTKTWLDNNYVEPIFNHPLWHERATAALQNDDVALFSTCTHDAIGCTARGLNHAGTFASLTTPDKSYIHTALRTHLQNELDHTPEQVKAEAFADQYFTERDQAQTARTSPSVHNLTKETIMAATTPFETRHFVYGINIADMSEDQLIEAIKKIEAEIAAVGTVKSKSSKLAAKTASLSTMLTKVVEHLDAL